VLKSLIFENSGFQFLGVLKNICFGPSLLCVALCDDDRLKHTFDPAFVASFGFFSLLMSVAVSFTTKV